MKIRNKITLIFLTLTSTLILLIFISIYYFTHLYTNKEFIVRLNERAKIIAKSYLEKDELNTYLYEKVLKKHLQKLPNEKEEIINIDSLHSSSFKSSHSSFYINLIHEIIKNKTANIKRDKYSYAGIHYEDNEGEFIVLVRAIDLYGQKKLATLKNILITAYIISILVVYFIGRYYSGKVLQPINSIIDKSNNISVNNLHLRLNEGANNDELSKLSKTINSMLDRLENSFELQNNFIDNASHEFKNPLTAIIGESDIALSRDREKSEYVESLKVIQHEALRLSFLIDSLLSLTKTNNTNSNLFSSKINIIELVKTIKNEIDSKNPKNQLLLVIESSFKHSQSPLIKGNKELLKSAFTNIIENACKFSDNNPVLIRLVQTDKKTLLKIVDHGIGIPPSELKKIFEPFYRASNVRRYEGSGIGLSLALKIIWLHDGEIEISSELNIGTEVDITF